MTWQRFLIAIVPWYIATGPVYWFFALQPGIFNAIKYFVAAAIIAIPIIFSSNTFYLRSGVVKASGASLIVGIIFLSLPSILMHQSIDGLAILSRYIILLGLLFSFVWVLGYQPFYRMLPNAVAYALIFLSCITLYDWLFSGNLMNFDSTLRLHKVGFSTTRTGWSSGLAVCASFMMWFFFITPSRRKYLYLTAFVLIVFSQLSSGGRGGLLTSLITATVLCIYYGKTRYLIGIALIGISFTLFNQEMLSAHLRFDRLGESSSTDFTSGRLSHYLMAIDMFKTPLDVIFGFGPHGYKPYFELQHISNEIHNVWLRLFVEYGILLPLFILSYIVYSLVSFYFKTKNNKASLGVIIVLICGLFPTLVEPNAIVFSYQNYLLWWLLFVSVKMKTVVYFVKC